METTTLRGRHAEAMAEAFLRLSGYRIRERNFRFSRLEVDLIVQKSNVLAVVEVKFRRTARLGGAVGAVSLQKQRDMETTAVGYLKLRRLTGVSVRFDVVTIEARNSGRPGAVIRHIPGAFSATGRYRL